MKIRFWRHARPGVARTQMPEDPPAATTFERLRREEEARRLAFHRRLPHARLALIAYEAERRVYLNLRGVKPPATLPSLAAYQAYLAANPFAARCADSYESDGVVEPVSVSQSPSRLRRLVLLAQRCASGTNGCWCRR